MALMPSEYIEGSSTGTIAKASGVSGTIDGRVCTKTNGLVNVGGRITGMTNQVANATLFKIPEGFRPPTSIVAACSVIFDTSPNETFEFRVNITTTGDVSIGLSSARNIIQIQFYATYGVVD